MRRVAVACLLAAWPLGGCGDNADPCGYVDPIETFKNIWSLQLAVDDTHIYFSDYDIDGDGTHLVLREPLAGGGVQALGIRSAAAVFGRGLALDGRFLYWASTSTEGSSSLFASPIAGGAPLFLSTLPDCAPSGIAVDGTTSYAGTVACGDVPSSILAVAGDGTTSTVWTSTVDQGDVRELAAASGTLFFSTTTGVFALRAGVLEILAGHPGFHLEVHDQTLYYSTDEGIFSVPVAGGDRVRLYSYPAGATDIGSFGIEGTDLYLAESGHMLLSRSPADTPRVVVENLGRGVGPIVARGGWAYWSVLFMPEAITDFGSFSGGVFRVLRPCD